MGWILPSSATAGRLPWSIRVLAIVWWCYPRFDSDPIFWRLLAGKEEKGFSDVVLDDLAEYQSEYVRNTAIVSTLLIDRQGGKVRITDFVPRFRQFGRIFRPPQIFRIIEPVAGLPRITIRMRPTSDYGKPLVQRSLGSNHIRYSGEGAVIRLTTDAPLSLIDGEAPFVLTRPLASGIRSGRAVPGRPADRPAATSSTAPATIGWNGCAGCRSPTIGRRRSSAPPSRSS